MPYAPELRTPAGTDAIEQRGNELMEADNELFLNLVFEGTTGGEFCYKASIFCGFYLGS